MPEIPPLPETTILLVEVGSTAHGTGLAGGEDHDEIGRAQLNEPPEAVLGLDPRGFTTVMQRTQPEGTRSGPVIPADHPRRWEWRRPHAVPGRQHPQLLRPGNLFPPRRHQPVGGHRAAGTLGAIMTSWQGQ